jgi:MFS family permease
MSAEISPPTSSPATDRAAGAASWLVLIVLGAAQLMVVIDGTVVNVALPSISRALSFGPGGVQWVSTVYLLCTGGMMLLAGRGADRFGRRRMLLAGTAMFVAASLASGLATDATMLICARAAQGVAAALLSPVALSVITTTYTGPRQARALSAWGAISAGGFVAGLLIGGVITTELGWRWNFFINVPLGAVMFACIPALVTVDDGITAGARPPRLPVAAAAALTAGLVAIVYAISGQHGWASPQTLAPAGAGVVLLAAFAALDRRSDHPMLAAVLLRTRSLIAGSVLMLAMTGVLGGTLFVTTFFIQQQLHASALRTGLDYLPFAVMIGLAAHAAPGLLSRLGTRITACAGLLAVAAGALLLAIAADDGYAAGLLPAFVLLGAGTGLTIVSASVTAMSRVPDDHSGAASGLLMTGHEAGGALGVAVFSAVATAAGAHGAAGLQIAAGHHVAFIVTSAAAAVLAVLAAVAMPAVRPPADGPHVRLH